MSSWRHQFAFIILTIGSLKPCTSSKWVEYSKLHIIPFNPGKATNVLNEWELGIERTKSCWHLIESILLNNTIMRIISTQSVLRLSKADASAISWGIKKKKLCLSIYNFETYILLVKWGAVEYHWENVLDYHSLADCSGVFYIFDSRKIKMQNKKKRLRKKNTTTKAWKLNINEVNTIWTYKNHLRRLSSFFLDAQGWHTCITFKHRSSPYYSSYPCFATVSRG